MAKTQELPEMVGEFIDLSKQYVREQTVEPAKQLGRLAGMGCAAAAVLVLALLFLSIAIVRWIIEALPEGALWSGLGYLLGAIAVLAVTGLFVGLAMRRANQ